MDDRYEKAMGMAFSSVKLNRASAAPGN